MIIPHNNTKPSNQQTINTGIQAVIIFTNSFNLTKKKNISKEHSFQIWFHLEMQLYNED